MKKVSLVLGGLLVLVALFVNSCGKDKETTIQKFIDISGAELVADDMPAATTDETIEVVMSSNVIPGSSSFIRVNTQREARKAYVGVKGQTGYYEVPVTASTREFLYDFVMIVNQGIDLGEEETFCLQVAILDAEGNVTQIWENNIGLFAVGTGELQISMTFDQHKDVDLHVIEPEYGEEPYSYYDRHIYFGHRTSPNGGELDLDSNASCSNSDVWAENITYSDSAFVAPGLYEVYAVMWSNCSPQDMPTNVTLSVFYGGQLIATENGAANPFVATFPADAPSTGSSLDMDPTLTFVIPDRGQRATKVFEPAPMTESAKEKMAMETEF